MRVGQVTRSLLLHNYEQRRRRHEIRAAGNQWSEKAKRDTTAVQHTPKALSLSEKKAIPLSSLATFTYGGPSFLPITWDPGDKAEALRARWA